MEKLHAERTESHWREGRSSPSGGSGAAGAHALVANTGGNREAVVSAHGTTFSRIRKRSFKRAIRRAQLQGETMYRGRKLVSKSPSLPVAVEQAAKANAKRRIRFLSWNVGGLSDLLFTELLQWLGEAGHQDVSIIILQETHWNFSGDWSTSDWHFCHSTTSRKGSGGILIGVRKKLSEAQHIRWHEAEPGRILQVRCFMDEQQLDIIGVYQHALLQTAGKTDQIHDNRRKLIKSLDKLLSALPVRSQILLGGDFNTTLVRENKVSGYGILERKLNEKERIDQDHMVQVLRKHRLATLNTWGKKTQAATYLHAKGRSQIDFVCVRQAVADGEAKQTRAIKTPMAGWRSTGHLPVVGSIPYRWTPWKTKPQCRQGDVNAREDDSKLIKLAESELVCSVEELREAVHQAGATAPAKVTRPVMETVSDQIGDSWKLRRKLRTAQSLLGAGYIFVFRFLRIRFAYLKAHRALKKALRNRKRQRTLQLLDTAEHAAWKHDLRGLYGVVHLLCPNKQAQKIRLRDKDGNLMCGADECRVLAEYARNLFMAPLVPRMPLRRLPMVEMDIDRWRRAAQRLQGEKAAPANTPPLRNWKKHMDRIVPILHKQATQALCQDDPSIPVEWTEVQLAWLAKPRKCPSTPANLRTVGLMSGDTKIFMSVLKEAVSDQIMHCLWDVPQFAYRQMSSTIDALLRGSLHCDQVRSRSGLLNTDVTSKLISDGLPELSGGLMISLDLAKAFDCMPFPVMYESLREVGVDDSLARVVVETHRQSVCVVRHGGSSIRVGMRRGLRQGCPLAPSVFTAWTIRLCRKLGPEWCRTHASLFADDVHGHWIITTVAQFQDARMRALKLIAELHRSGMKVNFDKSEAVLLLRGKAAAGLKKRYVQWSKDKYVLNLGTDTCTGREVRLPVVDRLEYLGVVLSYGSMESQTIQHRASKAWANFTKLRPMLRTSSAFSTAQRLRLFKACVVPALLYGVIGVGITASSLRVVTSTFARMLRKILRVYQQGISNQQVLERASFSPADTLRRLLQGKRCTLDTDGHQSPELRAPAQNRLQIISAELDRVEMLPQGGLVEIDDMGEAVTCPICGVEFHNQKSLEAHFSSKHAHVHQEARHSFDRKQHTLFGLPQCRLCRQTLFDWASMERHITEGRCPRLKMAIAEGKNIEQVMQQVQQEEERAPPKPPAMAPNLEQHQRSLSSPLLECPLAAVPSHVKEIERYQQQCLLCSQLIKAKGHMKTHWRTIHPDAWQASQQDALSSARSLKATFRRPCQYCGSTAQQGKSDSTHHATKCTPLFQVLAARKLHADDLLEKFISTRRGPALKQREKEPEYRAKENNSVLAMLRGKKRATTSDAGAAIPVTTLAGLEQSKATVPKGTISTQIDREGDEHPTAQGGLALLEVRLRNPHNLCYVNAGTMAMAHALQDNLLPRGLRPLREALLQARGRELVLSSHFGLRSIFQGWTFDRRQRDAAEFTNFILHKVGYSHVHWEARTLGRGAHTTVDSGCGMVYLDLPSSDCDIQELISAWSEQAHIHAFVSSAPIVIIQLGRFPHRGKSMVQVRFQQLVNMPVFANGVQRNWEPYHAVAGLIHIGESPHSGHYRSVLRVQQEWWITDDGVPAVQCADEAELKRGLYTVWLKRGTVTTSAAPAPSP